MKFFLYLVATAAAFAAANSVPQSDFTVTVTEEHISAPVDFSETYNNANCNKHCLPREDDIPDTDLATHFGLAFSMKFPIDGKFCFRVPEPADPDGWWETHFCTNKDIGLRWDPGRRIAGMDCTLTYEPADPHTWFDNFICVKKNSNYRFVWSFGGHPGFSCVQWLHTKDPHTWHDNFLCPVKLNKEITVQQLGLMFSSNGAVAGKKCVPMLNPRLKTWNNAQLCFDESSYGVQWSTTGCIANMRCTQIFEPKDSANWASHYLCVPKTNPWSFHFDPQQAIDGLSCIKIGSQFDNKWTTDYLCVA